MQHLAEEHKYQKYPFIRWIRRSYLYCLLFKIFIEEGLNNKITKSLMMLKAYLPDDGDNIFYKKKLFEIVFRYVLNKGLVISCAKIVVVQIFIIQAEQTYYMVRKTDVVAALKAKLIMKNEHYHHLSIM